MTDTTGSLSDVRKRYFAEHGRVLIEWHTDDTGENKVFVIAVSSRIPRVKKAV
jgi:hypothetical protein